MDKNFRLYFIVLFSLFFIFICLLISINFQHEAQRIAEARESLEDEDYFFSCLALNVLSASRKPERIKTGIKNDMERSRDFLDALSAVIEEDPFLWILVDKENSLDREYEPDDLSDIRNSGGNLTGHMIRKAALESLTLMTAAAEEDGVELAVLSAYRSYFYQSRVYVSLVSSLGQQEADRVSAKPGHSQHQLGLTVDFNSLENSFAGMPQGIWLAENASRFGWSISYPAGYEDVTGYDWESWHYRYVGAELALFINKYFNGIQQYALVFLREFSSALKKQEPF